MRRLELELVPSVELDGAAPSLRMLGSRNPSRVKLGLRDAGFKIGERVVVVALSELEGLERAGGRKLKGSGG